MKYDIDGEILYWIEQIGFEWKDLGKLIDYIKNNYVKTQREVVESYMEVMDYRNVDIDDLDWERICEKDEDYEELSGENYLNVYYLENDSLELKRLDLIE